MILMKQRYLKIRERLSSSVKGKGNSLPPSKSRRTVGTVRVLRSPPSSSQNPTGRATLTKKACPAGVKSIALNEREWTFHSDFRTFWTTAVFCLKGRLGRSRIDRV
ncbi:hypothetical protein AVEN_24598-1 [Araneus ventricosus]|uniref:Uncharacterized protein n=1 Tax=Araneus ventricosus TaxID=182803 RepID=A0A4Y2FBZ3_ARAVE|nr:hypothetical protein AVEN_24598-1 [Araneus ventricosus]